MGSCVWSRALAALASRPAAGALEGHFQVRQRLLLCLLWAQRALPGLACRGAETCLSEAVGLCTESENYPHSTFVEYRQRRPFLFANVAYVSARGWTSAPLSDGGPEKRRLCLW